MSSSRERILDETRRLIADAGAGVSMSRVAAAAGVSRQAVYLHFPTRGQLFLALVNRMDEGAEIRDRLTAALAAEDPADALERFIRIWLGFAAAIQPVATALLATRATDADAWAAWDDRMTELRQGHLHAARRLARAGRLRDGLNEATAADLTWALTSVPVWEQLSLDRGWPDRRTARLLPGAVVAAIVADRDA